MRYRHKLDTFMWFCIYNIPLLLLIVCAFMNLGATERITVTAVLSDWSALMPSVETNIIAKAIYSIMDYFGAESLFVMYGVQYVTFVILAHFLKIIEYVLVFFVHIVENLIEKWSFGKD